MPLPLERATGAPTQTEPLHTLDLSAASFQHACDLSSMPLSPSYPFISPSSYCTNHLKPIARRKHIRHLKPHWTPRSANVKMLPSTTSLCPVFLISRLLIGQCHVYLIPVGYPFRMSCLFTLHIIHQSLSAASNQWRSCSQPVCLHQ